MANLAVHIANNSSTPMLSSKASRETMLFETIVFTGFSVLQCALLHPKFQHSASARRIRLSLGPLTILWWLCYPFRSAIRASPQKNSTAGGIAAIMIFKSIDWTFSHGPFYLRQFKKIDGIPVFEKEQASKSSSKRLDWGEFVLWITMLFTSTRGMRWSWGPTGKGNTDSFAKSMLELIRLQMVMLPCVAFLLLSQDASTYRVNPTAVLLDLGLQPFPGINLLAECLLSATFMFAVSSMIEMIHLLMVLPTYLLYPLAKNIGFLSSFTEQVLNPVNHPQEFGSLFDLSSVSSFWGKSWHQKFRRAFLVCGGKPAMLLARHLGASEKFQKICGVMGAFAVSGVFHEYLSYASQQAPHPNPRELTKTFPGSFLFFFVQSFGIILEQIMIPRLPKSLANSGAKIWTVFFLFLTAPLFSHDCARPGAGLFDDYVHPSKWTWLHLIVPVPMALKVLG